MARECKVVGKAMIPTGDSARPYDTLIAFETMDDFKRHAAVAKGWPASDSEIEKAIREALKEEVAGLGKTFVIS